MLVFWVCLLLPLISGRGLHHLGPPVVVGVGPLFPDLLAWPVQPLGLVGLCTVRSLVGRLAALAGLGLGACAVQFPVGSSLGSCSVVPRIPLVGAR